MKILIVSDTHRQNGNLCKVLAMVGDYIDMLIPVSYTHLMANIQPLLKR